MQDDNNGLKQTPITEPLDLNPPSAPPGVTIGNFGFLNTLKDNFYTKIWKFQIAIASPKSPNDHFSLCDSLGCGMWV
jgi:hypothetical protein